MMTKTEKNTILEMRAEGITYKTIADKLGMSLGSVKMFVSRHKHEDDRRCERCGKQLPKGAGTSQRFCSPKCKNDWWYAHPSKTAGQKQNTCTCAVCGATFMSYKESKYCSRTCYYTSLRK